METLLQDIRYAFRTLARRPGFTFIAILTLALGIGANTAIFSVVDSVLLAPLPFRHVERLTVVWASNPELAAKVGLPDKLPVSPATFYDWKAARSFSKMAMVRGDRLSFTGAGEPELLGAVGVSGEFFKVLGVPALVGRALLPEDDDKGKATFAGLALVLAAVGIYGITAYSVAQRTREMGLRMALGAQPGTVLGMVLKEAGVLAGVGLAAGLALAATRVMASLLFGVPATDPTTFAAVALALAVVSLAAAYVPGRRATRVDPMVALRAD